MYSSLPHSRTRKGVSSVLSWLTEKARHIVALSLLAAFGFPLTPRQSRGHVPGVNVEALLWLLKACKHRHAVILGCSPSAPYYTTPSLVSPVLATAILRTPQQCIAFLLVPRLSDPSHSGGHVAGKRDFWPRANGGLSPWLRGVDGVLTCLFASDLWT